MGHTLNFILTFTLKCDITGTLLRFLENYCAAVTKKYWALKKNKL